MKTLFASVAIILYSLLSLSSFGQSATSAITTKTYQLTVVVSAVNQRSGTLRIGLANDEKSFTGESFKAQSIAVPASGSVQAVFDSLPAGKYAIRVLHDLNGNEKMDYNGQMPAEPFGFSNISMLMAPPSFDQAAFDLIENKSIEVSMIEM